MKHSERETAAVEWAQSYRRDFDLHAAGRAGRVELTVDDQHGALHMPATLAEQVLAVLERRGLDGPVVARNHHTYRWTFLVDYDRVPGHRHELELDLAGVCVQPPGSALELPAGYGDSPVATPGCWWVREPQRHELLPRLSVVISITLAVSAPSTAPIPRIADCSDCDDEPVDLTLGKARRIRQLHASHQPICKQALGARAYLSHSEDWYA